ncbi:HTH-type transcriptional regulator cbl [compost metagenome]
MLNIRYLAAVRAVMRTGSISGAARILFVTQPAVTKSIQLAEEELGIKLFIRSKGRLVATEEATFLYPEMERIFGEIVHLQDLAAEVRDGHAGRIALATVSNLSASLLGRAITQFRERHPKVRFDIEVHSTKLVLERVRLGQVGLGLLDLTPKDSADVDTVELGVAAVGCVMRKDHPLAGLESITPQALSGFPILTFPDDTTTSSLVREAFRHDQSACNIVMTVNHSYLACSLIDQGSGVGLIDDFHLHTDSFPRLTVRPFIPQIQLRPTVVITAGRTVSLIAREFMGELKVTAQQVLRQLD